MNKKKNIENDSFYLNVHVLVAVDRILSSSKTHWGMTLTCTVFACEKEQLGQFNSIITVQTLYSRVHI